MRWAVELGSGVIDLNFGCPAKTVNKSRGGAVLLKEPELLHAILLQVRRTVPAHIPVTAKMRLGFDTPDSANECAIALAEGGASQIVVHARTKMDGYKPPAHWEYIAQVQEAVKVPVFANGDIWSVEDWRRCREISGAEDIMLGRGLVSRPDLAAQIAAARAGVEVVPMTWADLQPMIRDFWAQAEAQLTPRSAPGRLKQWLAMLTRNYPDRVSKGEMLGVEDVKEILAVALLGVIPESQAVLKASNQGVPVILDDQSDAGQAYSDAVDRLLGKTVEHRFLDVQKKGFFERLFGGN